MNYCYLDMTKLSGDIARIFAEGNEFFKYFDITEICAYLG